MTVEPTAKASETLLNLSARPIPQEDPLEGRLRSSKGRGTS